MIRSPNKYINIQITSPPINTVPIYMYTHSLNCHHALGRAAIGGLKDYFFFGGLFVKWTSRPTCLGLANHVGPIVAGTSRVGASYTAVSCSSGSPPGRESGNA